MPRERSDFFRGSNTLKREKIFVIAFEGNVTEPQYFEAIKSHKHFNGLIYLKPLKRLKNDTNSAPKHVLKKILDYKKEFNFDSQDESWMIIDRDSWTDLDNVADQCAQNNISLALSNPCIEIWFYLHFQDILALTEEERLRIRLNGKISNSKRYLDKLLSDLLPNGYNKKNLNAGDLFPKLLTAITRAEALHTNLQEKYPSDLGSHIYILIKKLIDVDKLDIQ